MLRKLAWAVAFVTGVLGLLLVSGSAEAGVIFDADTSPASPTATFGRIGSGNCEWGTISAVTDATRGRMWRFHKPAGSDRCEAHGIRVGGGMYEFRNHATYYLGWRFKLTSTVDNNAIFKWKSYGNHIQNFPVVLKLIGGRLTMLQRQPGPVDYFPWSRSISANTWYHVVVGIHTSDAITGGWVEVYFNGVRQTFTNGATRWLCRTWDSINDPKWGIHGASDTTVTNYVDALRVGTSYADVAPGYPARPPAKAPPPAPPYPPAPAPPGVPASPGTPTPTPPGTPSPAPVDSRPAVGLAPREDGSLDGLDAGDVDTGPPSRFDAATIAILVTAICMAILAAFAGIRASRLDRWPRRGIRR